MARSIDEIYDSLIEQKEDLSSLDVYAPVGESYANLLNDITSASKVAFWRMAYYVVASFAYTMEVLWDLFKVEVNELVAQAKYGSLRWYVAQALLWQYGDSLSFSNNFPVYDPVDITKRLVTHASAIEDTGAAATVFVKCAKTDQAGLAPLSTVELSAFTAYMDDVKPAGIKLICSSLNADELVVNMVITYDPIRIQAEVETEVEAAIAAYLTELPFDAKFRRLAFEDALQQVEGVEQIKLLSLEGVQGVVVSLIDQEYIASAGYMTFDSVNSTITYAT